MRRRNAIIFILILVLISFYGYIASHTLYLGDYKVNSIVSLIKQGLDLRGGVEIVEEIQDKTIQNDTLDRTVQAIRQRVDKFGVIDPTIQKEGTKRIRIQIPGMSDQQKALDAIGKTGYLKFVGPNNDEIINGKDVKDAFVSFDQYNKAQITLQLNESGKSKFATATQKYLGKNIAIYLDDDQLANPTVEAVITDGNAVINNMKSTDEAKRIAQLIKSGALPVTLKVMSVRTVGPSLGSDALNRSVLAGAIGLAMVMLFMLVYYKLPGLIADIALVAYILLMLTIYVAFQATLSLAGISGFLLSIGMAVDANVLMFERMKEELRVGKTIKSAFHTGFEKSLPSIIDGNATTFIAGIVLVIVGTGPIQGFAVTLLIGIISSLITAVFVTRYMLNLVIDMKLFNNAKLFGAYREVR